jgi:hypothetical protein
MKSTLKIWFVLGLVPTAFVFADTIFVDGAGQNGMDEDHAAAVELIQSAAAEMGHRITEDAKQADYQLRPRLLRLGSAYILKLEKRKSGQTVFASQLKAQQAEELDRVAKRLTRAVISQKAAVDSARVGEVTNEESVEGTQRKPAVGGYHFALGPAFLGSYGASGLGYSFSLGKAWDVNTAMIRLRGDFFGKGSALGLDAGLSGQYFLMNSDYAPFVGAEFGFGFARQDTGALFNDDFHFGFWLGPLVGVQLFRTASVQMELSGKWSVLLASTPLGNPNYFTFRVGLYF